MRSLAPKELRNCLKCSISLIHTKFLCAICVTEYPNIIEDSRKQVLEEMKLSNSSGTSS